MEVIKREFIKNLEKDRSPWLKGLHQYNEILTLEELGVTVKPLRSKEDQENTTHTEETTRSQQVLQALSGRHQSVSLSLTNLLFFHRFHSFFFFVKPTTNTNYTSPGHPFIDRATRFIVTWCNVRSRLEGSLLVFMFTIGINHLPSARYLGLRRCVRRSAQS